MAMMRWLSAQASSRWEHVLMRRLLLALPVLCLAAALGRADDWPQWLGPRRDGVWRETGLLTKFPAGGPKVRWRTPIGEGYSGPSVANGNKNVPYYNGATATRGSGELTYAFNIQRQLGGSMVAEIGYLGTLASDIQSSLLAYDEIPYRNLPANLNPFTAAGRTLLTSQITSPAAVAAGITAPFAAFTQVFGSGATVGQALRPYPQYDRVLAMSPYLGRSNYQSVQASYQKRFGNSGILTVAYTWSRLNSDTDSITAFLDEVRPMQQFAVAQI